MTALVWLRQDLRLSDNPALLEAAQCGAVIPVFIDDPAPQSVSRLGAANRVWLHHALHALAAQLERRGSRLILRQGAALSVLEQLLAETGATQVVWNRCYDPFSVERDRQIKHLLQARVAVRSFKGNLFHEPWELLKDDGSPYRVYTPFWKKQVQQGLVQAPLASPTQLIAPSHWPSSLSLEALALLPSSRWDQALMQHWTVGEAAAVQRVEAFFTSALSTYAVQRDYPASAATSRLSPYLHWGEISVRQLAWQLEGFSSLHPEQATGAQRFLQELVWREFSYHLLYHYPHTLTEPLDPKFQDFMWEEGAGAEQALRQWQQGQTGIPLVDAGMRELWHTGWMHNRVRMVVASWLVKNLLISWQAGERWFRDTLVDADLANNALSWQWVAGCGADAAPYFRVFNPVLQGEKFDPTGEYVRRWVPELAQRPLKELHQPRVWGDAWQGYPHPSMSLAASRQRALERFAALKVKGKR